MEVVAGGCWQWGSDCLLSVAVLMVADTGVAWSRHVAALHTSKHRGSQVLTRLSAFVSVGLFWGHVLWLM